ncbi:hypothetical protein ASD50_14985 [Mesorhizobium sp. Root552]|uniref:hypothetical protein n=1 Tax=Mesorhizobium sp. Root552 TaxID=1736555 RepID=UPI0006F74CB3|nr:hypothetical protein [Mesorhizobium sp. Root552]KQZ31572.1 hypothetical protein ASD50_14985 [Mesorhizobium sp. Root552]
MSQSDFGTINAATKSGSALATDLNSWRNALHSNHKGSAEPSYKATGMTWLDDSLDPIWIYKVYDGTTWIPLLEIDVTANVAVPAGITSRLKFPLAGGSANALTITPAVAMAAYADQDVVTFEAASNNSGAATLNISGVGAKAIRKIIGGADVALASGDLRAGGRYMVNYDSAANSAAGAWVLTSLPITLGTTVDSAAAGNDSRITGALQRSGGTMTGKITLDGDPSSNLHAGTKQYIDGQDLGIGQTHQAVSRTLGTSYQNTTGKPIVCYGRLGVSASAKAQVSTDNSTWVDAMSGGTAEALSFSFVVPPGHYYKVIVSGSISQELR